MKNDQRMRTHYRDGDLSVPANLEKHEKEFPPLDELKKRINALEALDLKTVSDQELAKLIWSMFPTIGYLSAHIPAGTYLYRARINKGDVPYIRFGDITAPPANRAKDYGRANMPKERIFYGATNLYTAAYELIHNPEVASKGMVGLTVGKYLVKEDLHVTLIIHSKILHDVRPDVRANYESHMNTRHKMSSEGRKAEDMILKFFSDQFTKQVINSPHDYKVSAFYMSRLKRMNLLMAGPIMKGSSKYDGINYPSVAMKFQGDNVALVAESLQRKLTLVGAACIECKEIDLERCDFKIKVLQVAESASRGEIVWRTNTDGREGGPYDTLQYMIPNFHE